MDDFAIEPSAEPLEYTLYVPTNGTVTAGVVASFLIAIENAIRHPDIYGPEARVELVRFEQSSLKWIVKIVRGTSEAIGVISAATWLGLIPAELSTFEEVRNAIEDRIVVEMTLTGEGEKETIDLTQVWRAEHARWPASLGGRPNLSPAVNYSVTWPKDPSPRSSSRPPSPPTPPPDDESTKLTGVLARTEAGELRFFSEDARLFAAEFVNPLLASAPLSTMMCIYTGRIVPRDYLPLFRIEEIGTKPF